MIYRPIRYYLATVIYFCRCTQYKQPPCLFVTHLLFSTCTCTNVCVTFVFSVPRFTPRDVRSPIAQGIQHRARSCYVLLGRNDGHRAIEHNTQHRIHREHVLRVSPYTEVGPVANRDDYTLLHRAVLHRYKLCDFLV